MLVKIEQLSGGKVTITPREIVPHSSDHSEALRIRFAVCQMQMNVEFVPTLHFGDASRSALMPSILDTAFKREL